MELILDIPTINRLIENQRSAIRFHLIFAITLVAAGVIILTVSLILPGKLIEEGIKTLLSIGGAFVSSLSSFQFREIPQRKEKIIGFETVRGILLRSKELGEIRNKQELDYINGLMTKILEKITVS